MRPTFYTSDTHFGHEKVITYCSRPFESLEEMNEALICRWNSKVPKDGLVYHLGDVLFGGSDVAKQILPRLNGEKVLIVGNHDKAHPLQPYFSSINPMLLIHDDVIKRRMFLCHYPVESWPAMRHNMIHLHGHCHGNLDHLLPNRMDVGVDCHPGYEPFSSKEVLKLLNQRNQ